MRITGIKIHTIGADRIDMGTLISIIEVFGPEVLFHEAFQKKDEKKGVCHRA